MPGIVVIADSREQEPYSFEATRITTVRRALPAGDYSLDGLEDRVAVERMRTPVQKCGGGRSKSAAPATVLCP
jgi:ERCC4-type nuclease